MGEAGLSPQGAQAADEWDDVMSVDGDAAAGWAARAWGACLPWVSSVLSCGGVFQRHRSPHHLADPLLLGGAPVAAVPAHVMTRDGGSSQQSSSSKSGALQGGVELKKAKSNPLLGQWHNFVDRSHPNVRPSE